MVSDSCEHSTWSGLMRAPEFVRTGFSLDGFAFWTRSPKNMLLSLRTGGLRRSVVQSWPAAKSRAGLPNEALQRTGEHRSAAESQSLAGRSNSSPGPNLREERGISAGNTPSRWGDSTERHHDSSTRETVPRFRRSPTNRSRPNQALPRAGQQRPTLNARVVRQPLRTPERG